MIISTKELLDKLGKNQFMIENCAKNPEVAIKLFLLGESLNLEPIFVDKDQDKHKNETENNILNSSIKVYIDKKKYPDFFLAGEHTLGSLYKKIKEKIKEKSLNPEMLKTILKILEKEILSPPSTPSPTNL